MGLLTDNNHDISRVGWNDAFGEPILLSIINQDAYIDLYGGCQSEFEIKSLANSLISMLPDPADELIHLIYKYHRYRGKLPYDEWHRILDRFLEHFCPCNGGFEFDYEMTKKIKNISLDMKTYEGKSVKLGIRNLVFVQQIVGDRDLYMTFQIGMKFSTGLSLWNPFLNMYYKFLL